MERGRPSVAEDLRSGDPIGTRARSIRITGSAFNPDIASRHWVKTQHYDHRRFMPVGS